MRAPGVIFIGGRWQTPESHERRKARLRARYAADPEKYKSQMADYWRRNKARISDRKKRQDAKNRDRINVTKKRWREINREKMNACERRRRQKNPEKFRLASVKCTARRRARVHPDLDYGIEQRLFEVAQNLTRTTGTLHEVDHIIPLSKGGWHHHDNMQVLPYALNRRKSNNHMWECVGYKSWRDVPEMLWPELLANTYRSILNKPQQ